MNLDADVKLNKTNTFLSGLVRKNDSNKVIDLSLEPPSTPKFNESLNRSLSARIFVYDKL
jgi:hypothetical protein